MNLYDQKIDEFVDWTGDSSTQNLPVTGGRIRELLQERLKTPFYMYYDKIGKLYRIFSSKGAYEKWLTREDYPEYAELELFNFVAPSPYNINIFEYGSNSIPITTDTRYVRLGVESEQTKLRFSWRVFQDEDYYSDNVIVTYTIENNGETKFVGVYNNSQRNVEVELLPYLKEGTNRVTVHFQGETCKATKNISLDIEMINLSLNVQFDYYRHAQNNQTRNANITVNSTSGISNRIVSYIDGDLVNNAIQLPISQSYPTSQIMSIPFAQNLSKGKHSIQFVIESKIPKQDGSFVEGLTFYSNTEYFEFAIPSDSDDKIPYVLIHNTFQNVEGGVVNPSAFQLEAAQYERFDLDWGYTSNDAGIDTNDITWSITDGVTTIPVLTAKGTKDTESDHIQYVPAISSRDGVWKLVASYQVEENDRVEGVEYDFEYPIYIKKSSYDISEVAGYQLKLTAVGKTNNDHTWEYGDVTSTFNNFSWDSRCGWNNGSLVIPEGSSVDVDYQPLLQSDYGRTVEIEFSTSNIGNPNSPIATFGGGVNGAKIVITPNSAYFQAGGAAEGSNILKTNFKDGERVKVCFIINPAQNAPSVKDNSLMYIVTNGVLERVVSWEGATVSGTGKIHIGGNDATITIYSIRCYDRYITCDGAFNNFAIDSNNTGQILSRNNIYNNLGNIDFDLLKSKVDTILITGNLANLLNSKTEGEAAKKEEMAVDIQRISLSDPDRNFIIKNAKIRKHGQSTLNYPIPSFKIWSDQTDFQDYFDKQLYTSSMYYATSEEDCTPDNVIYKGRYSMKEGSIPVKKWVLQANYADSSGVHNGGLQRLIQDTWYNAEFGSNREHKLRTPPQLFSTNEGTSNVVGKTNQKWSDFRSEDFPYEIRVSPDSFPCVIFWRETAQSGYNFLGQYVFMDDKKSDYVYGERSIYNIKDDPFCLKEGNKGLDTNENCVWDNKSVLRLEVLDIDSPFVDYRSMTDDNGVNFEQLIVDDPDKGEDGYKYNWENYFELVYPDKEDITSKYGNTKVFDRTKFDIKVKPFVDWYKWLVSTKGDQAKFEAEAADHIDLYKIAAYYIYVLRFGLVDSLERNAQIKTYDGQHFWYESWDMDIALGNRNTGGIAFDPPIDRDTPDNSDKNAISGKTPKGTSNWMFDALEAWPQWMDKIVPEVAASLYKAGLTYDIVTDMFDNKYASAWCERVYNASGHYKYIENGGGSFYPWCQGARTTHRHWWTKTSLDYYDAKWKTGEFLNRSIYLAAGHQPKDGDKLGIKSSTNTYFGLARETSENMIDFQYIVKGSNGGFDISTVTTSPKTPIYIYGAPYIQELDLSAFAASISIVNLSGCYSEESGSNLRTLTLGVPLDDVKNGVINNDSNFTIGRDDSGISDTSGNNSSQVLKELTYFNINGFAGLNGTGAFATLMKSMQSLEEFHAIGSGLTTFPGIGKGTRYKQLRLPNTISTLTLYDASWDEGGDNGLTFWKVDKDNHTISKLSMLEQDLTENANGTQLKNLSFTGNTGRNDCARKLLLKWIEDVEYYGGDLSKCTFVADDIYWPNENVSYDQLMKIGQFNSGDTSSIKGYIMLSDNQLDATQIQNIQNVFGDSVFDKNSGGLKVDYKYNTIIATVGSPAYMEDGKIYVEEGYQANGDPVRVVLKATKFMLTTEKRNQTWAIMVNNAPIYEGDNYCGAYLKKSGGNMYLYVPEMRMQNGSPVEFLTLRVVDEPLDSSGQAQTITIRVYIKHKSYPTGINIYATDSSHKRLVHFDGKPVISQIGSYILNCDLDFGDNELHNTVSQYAWTITSNDSNLEVRNNDGRENAELYYGSIPGTQESYADVTCTVTFSSGFQMSKSITVVIADDPIVLTTDSNFYLYRAFRNEGFTVDNNSNYTKYCIAAITAINFSSDNDNPFIKNIESFMSNVNGNDHNISTYLRNVEILDVSNCYNVTDEGQQIKLSSLINIIANEKIRTVNLRNTESSLYAHMNQNLRHIYLGKPSYIHITSCQSVEDVTVQDYSNLEEINAVITSDYNGMFTLAASAFINQQQ